MRRGRECPFLIVSLLIPVGDGGGKAMRCFDDDGDGGEGGGERGG